jgi:hypothetical protein
MPKPFSRALTGTATTDAECKRLRLYRALMASCETRGGLRAPKPLCDTSKNWSIWLDVTILIKTIPAVVRRRGAY